MTFNQRELAAFLAVARSGGVGAAARTLSLTQPAITRSLKRLEQQLGVALFVRHSTGMEMTPFGRALAPYAEMLESETQRVVEEIRVLNGAAAGLARIGIVPSVSANLLPLAIERVLAASPGVQVRVIETTGDQLTSSLIRGEIDFAIIGLPSDPVDEHVLASPLMEDEICIIARAKHPLTEDRRLRLPALRESAWAMPEKGNVIREGFDAIFRRAKLQAPKVAVTTNSVHALKSIAASTNFLTMLARVSIQMEEQAGILAPLPLAEGRWRRQLGVLRRGGGLMLPAAALLLSEIKRAAASLRP
ncbi:LysR family transcriptional regulator [Terrarubrum flagellatum]|uniref:LysR family transcriptional regulator n=1 Tax=Terrirubrum flagellatum TaxID=2895980 RepID=UPI0031455A44